MVELVNPILLVWTVLSAGLFLLTTPRRAALLAFVLGWLFLPQGGMDFAGLPDLSKSTSTPMGVLLGMALFDAGRLAAFRPRWVDLPIAVWCLAPLFSSLSNQIGPMNGLWDGLSGLLGQALIWGVPYLVGRLYLTDWKALEELAVVVVIGGLLYVPLCLYEIRMSPQLHRMVYGFHPSTFLMSMRWGGYRPMVFMQHGLMLGLWMTATSLVAFWLWMSGTRRRLFGVPMGLLVLALLVTTVLCKSTGALLLLVGGIGLLFTVRFIPLSIIVVLVIATIPTYIFVRINGMWDAEQVVQLAAMVDEERASSLEGRLYYDDLLAEKALEKPVFGWGGWGRWRVYDDLTGRDVTVSDSFWIIAFGHMGFTGLIASTTAVLLPVLLLLRFAPVRAWTRPAVAPAAAFAVVLILYMMDNMLNAMVNPIYAIMIGGLTGTYVHLYLVQREAQPVASPWNLPARRARRSVPARSRRPSAAGPAAVNGTVHRSNEPGPSTA